MTSSAGTPNAAARLVASRTQPRRASGRSPASPLTTSPVTLPEGHRIDVNDARFVALEQLATRERWSQATFSSVLGLESRPRQRSPCQRPRRSSATASAGTQGRVREVEHDREIPARPRTGSHQGGSFASRGMSATALHASGLIEAIDLKPDEAEFAVSRWPFAWSRTPDPKSFARWPWPTASASGRNGGV